MQTYSVDANGLVVAATKNVERKVQELLKAQEELTITKLLANIRNMQNMGEIIPTPACLPANATATKEIRFKKTGYTKTTKGRKLMILQEWIRSPRRISPHSNLNFDEFEAFIKRLGRMQATRFGWCSNLSQVAILNAYNYVLDAITK